MASDQSENQLVAAGGGGNIEPKDLRYAFGDFSFVNTIKDKESMPYMITYVKMMLEDVFNAINSNNAWVEIEKDERNQTGAWFNFFSDRPSTRFEPTPMMILVKNSIKTQDVDSRMIIWIMDNMCQIIRDGWNAYVLWQTSDNKMNYYDYQKKYCYTFSLRDGPPYIPEYTYALGDFSFISPWNNITNYKLFKAININNAWKEIADENLGRIDPKENFSDDCKFMIPYLHDSNFRRRDIRVPNIDSAFDEIQNDNIIKHRISSLRRYYPFERLYNFTPLTEKLLGKNDEGYINEFSLEILYQMKIIANFGWNVYVDMMTNGTAKGSAEGLAPKVP
jgi:hypothetical protein